MSANTHSPLQRPVAERREDLCAEPRPVRPNTARASATLASASLSSPAQTWDCALPEPDEPFNDPTRLAPEAFIDPEFDFPYTLERALHAAMRPYRGGPMTTTTPAAESHGSPSRLDAAGPILDAPARGARLRLRRGAAPAPARA